MRLLEELSAVEEVEKKYAAAKKELGERLELLGATNLAKNTALLERDDAAFSALEQRGVDVSGRIAQLREECSAYQKGLISEKVESLLDAYNREVEKYNSSFEKKYSDYCKARAALAEMFRDLVARQREILETKERLIALIQMAKDDGARDALQNELYRIEQQTEPEYMKRLKLLPLPNYPVTFGGYPSYPDAAMFINYGDVKEAEANGISSVALHRQACSESYLKNGPRMQGFPTGGFLRSVR